MAHTYGTKVRLPATATSTTANPANVALTCGAGTTVLWLGIVVGTTTARLGGAPTYNGIAMTQAGSDRNAGGTPETHVEQWYLLDPPTGASYTLSIPNTNTRALTLSAATGLAGSGKWSLLDAESGASGSSTNPAASITTTRVGDIIFAVCGDGGNSWNPTARTGTQLHDWDAGTRGHGTQYIIMAGSGAQATNWTFGTSEDWAISNAAFRLVSGVRDAGVVVAKAALHAPTISCGATTAVDGLAARGSIHDPIMEYDCFVAPDLLIAVAEFFGEHTETATGITLEQHLPLYGKASQHEATVAALLTPSIQQSVLHGYGGQLAPTVVAADNIVNVIVQVGVQEATGIQLDLSTGGAGTFAVDLLTGVAVLNGEHTETADGITLAQHVPLYAKASVLAPTIDVTLASTHRTVEVECLTAVADEFEPEAKATPGIAVDCLTGVAELFGTLTESQHNIILEQRLPLSAKATWLQHDISVNTEYSQPVDVNPEGPLVGTVELFGSHMHSDIILEPTLPHEVVAGQYEPTIDTVLNPAFGADHLSGVASPNAPTVAFEVTVFVEALTGVAEQFTFGGITEATPLPDALAATAAAKAPTIQTRSYVYPDALEAVAVQQANTVRGCVTVPVDAFSVAAVQFDFAGHTNSSITPDPLVPAGSLHAPSIQTRSYVYPETLEAVAVQNDPAQAFGINVYPAADHLAGVAEQFDVEVAEVGSPVVHVDCLSANITAETPAVHRDYMVTVGLLEAVAVQETLDTSGAVSIDADCTAAVAEQFAPTISPIKNVRVTTNTIVGLGKMKSPTVYYSKAGAIIVDHLTATGGMRTPAIYDYHIVGLLRVLLTKAVPSVTIEQEGPYVTVIGEVE